MDINPVDLQMQATVRYLTDPLFHARVNVAIQMAGWTYQHETGLSLGEAGLAMSRQAAAYALLTAELEFPQEFLDEAIPSMREQAEALGFSLGQSDGPAPS